MTRARLRPSCAIARPTNRRQLNFAFKNRIQRKFSPQHLKQIAAGWQDKTVAPVAELHQHIR